MARPEGAGAAQQPIFPHAVKTFAGLVIEICPPMFKVLEPAHERLIVVCAKIFANLRR